MTLCFSQPKIPAAQPIQQAPTLQDTNVTASGDDATRRARAAAGANSTMVATGDATAPLLNKTLLGQ